VRDPIVRRSIISVRVTITDMEPTATPTHAGNFLSRVLDPLAHALNREAAESILSSRIDPEIQARVAALAERANEGELTPEERDEYLSYVEAADMLAVFKLKARRRLAGDG
jgi:hypothetical protein